MFLEAHELPSRAREREGLEAPFPCIRERLELARLVQEEPLREFDKLLGAEHPVARSVADAVEQLGACRGEAVHDVEDLDVVAPWASGPIAVRHRLPPASEQVAQKRLRGLLVQERVTARLHPRHLAEDLRLPDEVVLSPVPELEPKGMRVEPAEAALYHDVQVEEGEACRDEDLPPARDTPAVGPARPEGQTNHEEEGPPIARRAMIGRGRVGEHGRAQGRGMSRGGPAREGVGDLVHREGSGAVDDLVGEELGLRVPYVVEARPDVRAQGDLQELEQPPRLPHALLGE
nr:hypothetical protein [Thermophilibacter provencensis]